MGYRSTVYFGVEEKHASKLEEIVKEHEESLGKLTPIYKKYPNYDRVTTSSVDKWVQTEDVTMVIYHLEYVKWYDEYPEVKAIEDFIDTLSQVNHKRCRTTAVTSFLVGLGEDGNILSTSEIGDWWDYIDHISKLEIQE